MVVDYQEDEFENSWPVWQEGMEEKRLVSVEVEDTLNNLFAHLFKTQSAFQKKAQDARRYTQLQETNWTMEFSDLPRSQDFKWPVTPPDLVEQSPRPGMMRKLLFTCPGNALHPGAFRTEQVERCTEYVPGRRFVVDVCVLSSPMYCDRFRPIVRYTGERLSGNTVKLTVDSQIVYVAKVNFVLKKFIEGSARGGMEESFRKWLDCLEEHYPSGVVDLLSPSKNKAGVSKKKTNKPVKQLKSYRLTDVPLELEEDEGVIWPAEKEIPTSASIALLLLALLLPILRIAYLIAEIPKRAVDVARRSLSWSIVLQALSMLLLALLVHYFYPVSPSSVFSILDSAYCNRHGAVVCFATSFVFSAVLQRVFLR